MALTSFALPPYLAVAALASVSFLLGQRLLRGRLPGAAAGERLALCTSLGLGVLATVVGGLGLLGLLRPWLLLSLGAGAVALGAPSWRCWAQRLTRLRVGWPGRATSIRLLCLVALVALGWRILLLPLYPPLDFDANAYHLAVARTYAREGAVFPTPFLRFPVGPLNAHMLFTLLLIFVRDPAAAGLVSLLAAVLISTVVYAWASDGSSGAAGWIAVALWASSSLVLDRAHTASYHMICALMTTMAVRCLARFAASSALSWLVLSAVFSGLAVGTYYLGIFFAVALGLAVAFLGWSARRAGWPVVYAIVLVLAAAPWLARNAVHSGNPVWPFFGEFLGVGPWWDLPDLEHVIQNLTLLGRPRTLVNLLRVPYDLTFHPETFQPTGTLSVAPLLSLPLIAAAAFKDHRIAALLALTAAFGAFWFMGAQALRYLLPALPLLAVAAARSWALLVSGPVLSRTRRLRAAVEIVLLGSLLLPAFAYLEEVGRARGPLPVDAAARNAWTEARVPGYGAILVANRAPAPLYSLNGLWLAAASEGRFMGDLMGPGRYRDVVPHLSSGEALYAALRKLGARYFLLNRLGGAEAPADDAGFAQRFAVRYTSGAAELFELRDEPHLHPWPLPDRLRNGDFEGADTGASPADWTVSGRPELRNDAPFVHQGSGSVALGSGSITQVVAVSSGEACTLAVWARTRRAARKLVVEVGWLGPSQSRLRAERSEIDVPARWIRVVARRLAPEGAAGAAVRFETMGGQVFVDAASFRCLDQPETRRKGGGPER